MIYDVVDIWLICSLIIYSEKHNGLLSFSFSCLTFLISGLILFPIIRSSLAYILNILRGRSSYEIVCQWASGFWPIWNSSNSYLWSYNIFMFIFPFYKGSKALPIWSESLRSRMPLQLLLYSVRATVSSVCFLIIILIEATNINSRYFLSFFNQITH